MNYARFIKYDALNGRGVRCTVFVSGCTHSCRGCFNEKANKFSYGNEFDEVLLDDIIATVKKDSPKVDGLSLLGGCPMCNAKELLPFVKRFKEECPDKDVWVWCGETFEECLENPIQRELLNYIDVLIDGKFEEDKKDLKLYWRGSSNQRIIDVKESLKCPKTVVTLVR